MAGHSSIILGLSWTDFIVLGSQLFGHASAENYEDILSVIFKCHKVGYIILCSSISIEIKKYLH